MTCPIAIRTLRPTRALLHPLWIGALVLLAFNDHFLKTAAFLPGAVTGKLSDVAGLVVAPALFAAVVGVTTRRALLACHATVALVFSAIQLWPWAATTWSGLMGLVGFPWVITRDPTDLLALPALALSWRYLTPAMTRRWVTNARRSAEVGAASVGLVCCVATSPGPFPEEWGPIDADVFLHNPGDESVTLRVRTLKPTVELDCAGLGQDPGALLGDELFEPSVSWQLDPGAAAPVLVNGPEPRDCHVALLDADGLAPTLLHWTDGEPPWTTVWPEEFSDARGAVLVSRDGSSVSLESDLTDLLHDRIPAEEPPVGGSCAGQSDADRLAWSTGAVAGQARRIEALEVGADGCLALSLATVEDLENEVEPPRAYLCVPAEQFPFAVGDWIEISGSTTLLVEQVDETGTPVLPSLALLAMEATAPATISDLELDVRPDFGCDLAVHDTCGSVGRPARVQAMRPELGGVVELAAGETAELPGADDSNITLHVVHALHRVAVDADCALGATSPGGDAELVVVYRGPDLP